MKRSQYEEHAARLLKDKRILAYILMHSVEDFKDYSFKEIMDAIEGEIRVEDRDRKECDIFFSVKGKDHIQRVVSLTVFKSPPAHIVDAIAFATLQTNVGMFVDGTVAKMISVKEEDALMYRTVWILVDVPDKEDEQKLSSDSISQFVMTVDDKIGNVGSKTLFWQKELFKSSVICIKDDGGIHSDNELCGILSVLLSAKMPVDEKKAVLEETIGITMTEEMENECRLLLHIASNETNFLHIYSEEY